MFIKSYACSLIDETICWVNVSFPQGPFVANVHTLDECESDGTYVFKLRVSHFNPSRPYLLQNMSGTLKAREDFDDSLWVGT